MKTLTPFQFLDPNQSTVTPDDIDRLIASSTIHSHVFLGRITVIEIELPNGFTVSGRSACVCEETFNAEIGMKIAIDDAKEKLWQYLGWELAQSHSRNS